MRGAELPLRAGSGAAQELLAALDPKDRGHATIAHAAGAVLAHEFVARRTPLDGWEHGAPGAKAREAFDDLLESFVHPGLMHGFLYTLVAERGAPSAPSARRGLGLRPLRRALRRRDRRLRLRGPAHGAVRPVRARRRCLPRAADLRRVRARRRRRRARARAAMCVNGWRMELRGGPADLRIQDTP